MHLETAHASIPLHGTFQSSARSHNEGPAGRFTLCRHRALGNYRRLIVGSVVLESKIGHKLGFDRKMSWPIASTSGPGFPDRINQYLTHLVFPIVGYRGNLKRVASVTEQVVSPPGETHDYLCQYGSLTARQRGLSNSSGVY